MGTKIFALIVLVILAAFVVGLIVILGGLPGKIAAQRDHPNKDAIKISGGGDPLDPVNPRARCRPEFGGSLNPYKATMTAPAIVRRMFAIA